MPRTIHKSADRRVLAGALITTMLLVVPAYGDLTAVIFDNGQVQGTATDASTPNNGVVSIVVSDGDLTDNVTSVQLDKTFDRYIIGGGQLPPTGLPLLVQVDLPSAQDVGAAFFDIQLSDEQVRNNTVTPWWDYEIILIPQTPDLSIEVLNPPDGTMGDFFTQVEGTGPLSGRWFGGVWPNDGLFHTLFQSPGGAPFTLRVVLQEVPVTFLIKERPSIPEPASMALLGLGGVIGLIRRRR